MKRNYRFLAILLTLCMVLSMLPLTALAASLTFTDEYGTWEYVEEADGTITIVGFTAARKNVAVPSEIDGKPVRKLGDGLFKDNNDITMVVIPDGIRIIGAEVFSGCTYLERVELPHTLTSIGDGAFSDCAVLGDLYVPASVKELGEGVFADSPQIHVTCDINCATANYLRANRTEVPHFTLLEVQKAPADTVPTGVDGVTKGKLVTYEFGSTINGKREYTLVLADSMPGLDLAGYLSEDGGFDFQIFELMQSRFQLVSLTRYDGSATLDITPRDGIYGVEPLLVWDGNSFSDVEYIVYLNQESDNQEGIANLTFSSSNQLLGYVTDRLGVQNSQVKQDSGEFTFYTVHDGDWGEHYADGLLVREGDYSGSRAHRVAVDGSCVEISIYKSSSQNSGQAAANFENSNLTVKDANGNRISVRLSNATDKDGFLTKSGTFHRFTGTTQMATKHISVSCDQDGAVDHVWKTAVVPAGDGVYQRITSSFDKEESRDFSWEDHYTEEDGNGNVVKLEDYRTDQHTTQTDSLSYTEKTVYAADVSETIRYTNSKFPNEPSEHEEFVSERHVDTRDSVVDSTRTDLNTGDMDYTKSVGSWEELSNHIYIGETGKYVGWDWVWDYAEDIDPETNQTISQRGIYTVTEYNYSYDSITETDTWTKTTVRVTAKDQQSIEAFKQTVAQGALAGCSLDIEEYVFDSTVAGGADNWRPLEPVKPTEPEKTDKEDPEKQEELAEPTQPEDPEEGGKGTEQTPTVAEAIVMGTTSVTVGETEIKQADKKQEMLNLENKLLTEMPQADAEEYFEEVLDTVLDGDNLLAEVESGLANNTVPESNTTEELQHDCVLPDPIPEGLPVG